MIQNSEKLLKIRLKYCIGQSCKAKSEAGSIHIYKYYRGTLSQNSRTQRNFLTMSQLINK